MQSSNTGIQEYWNENEIVRDVNAHNAIQQAYLSEIQRFDI